MKIREIKTRFLLIFLVVGIGVSLIFAIHSMKEKAVWSIAMVGPISGMNAKDGKSMKQGVRLYLDQINRRGGIQGRKVELSIFDDQNDPAQALAVARRLVAENRFLAVIGHRLSSSSMSAGEVYAEELIPAITPTATSVQLTEENEWFFSGTFNNRSQSRFLANISQQILNQQRVSIIHEPNRYGIYLADVFRKTSKELGVVIANDFRVETEPRYLDRDLKAIVAKLKRGGQQTGSIFLATYDYIGIKLLKLIKEAGLTNPIITPDSFAGSNITEAFQKEPLEQTRPGFYTEGIHVSAPLIFDTANEQAQQFREQYLNRYNEEPDWIAASSYDCSMLIVEAIAKAKLSASDQEIKMNRKRIRNFLANLNHAKTSIPGVTGLNYFDQTGGSQKVISLGIYKGGRIVSSLIQLREIQDYSEIPNLKQSVIDGDILRIEDRYMHKVNVVYTGIKIKKIDDLDLKQLESSMEFFLWFRFQQGSDIKPEDIQFLNAVGPITLTAVKNRDVDRDGISYRLFQAKGRFKVDFMNVGYTSRRHDLGIRFRHKTEPYFNLIYVRDELGMGLKHGNSISKKLKDSNILDRTLDWIAESGWVYQDVVHGQVKGNPDYLKVRDGQMKYSRFNFGIRIKKENLTLRGIDHEYLQLILFISAVGSLILFPFPVKWFKLCVSGGRFLFPFHTMSVLALLLTSEEVLLQSMRDVATSYHSELLIIGYDILWWVVPGLLVNRFIELFLWQMLEKSSGTIIPRMLRKFVSVIVYLLVLFGVIAFVYDQKLTGLLATSGVVAMIVGLAIRMNISNLFSGIAINIERPLRIDDWVQIGKEKGKVLDINWRATRLLQENSSILSIPNSVVADSTIHNFNYPESHYWENCVIHLPLRYSPERVKKILYDAINTTEEVLKTPKPIVRMQGLTEWSANYNISFCVSGFSSSIKTKEAVWLQIRTHLNYAGIRSATQQQQVHLFKGSEFESPIDIS